MDYQCQRGLTGTVWILDTDHKYVCNKNELTHAPQKMEGGDYNVQGACSIDEPRNTLCQHPADSGRSLVTIWILDSRGIESSLAVIARQNINYMP